MLCIPTIQSRKAKESPAGVEDLWAECYNNVAVLRPFGREIRENMKLTGAGRKDPDNRETGESPVRTRHCKQMAMAT